MIDFKWAFDNAHIWRCSAQESFVNHPGKDCNKIHYGVKWPPGDPDEWDVWIDGVGQPFTAGDLVAVATVSNRSPQMVVIRVTRINRRRKGTSLFVNRTYYETENGRLPPGLHYNSPGRPPTVVIPSCTVTGTPVYARFGVQGPWDSGTNSYSDKPKARTYTMTSNIIALPASAAALFT